MLTSAAMAAARNRMRPKHRIVPTLYLRAWLDHLGVRQYELADRLGVDKSVITKLIAGKTEVTLVGLVAMAEALGMSNPNDLLRHPDSSDQQESETHQMVASLDADSRARAMRALAAYVAAERPTKN